MNRSLSSSAGLTLVEVLIAQVVMSIGMLAIAALHLHSLRATRSALVLTQAVTLAADMADRIRANRDPANAYDCGGTCDSGEGGNAIAAADVDAWRAAVAAQLPDGNTSITYATGAANAPDVYTVTVGWTELGHADALEYQLRVEI
jgi:type IV pilus assembly protein PilV